MGGTNLNNYKDEIIYREELLQKIRDNVKITPDERIWLITHPIYNQRFGFSFFNVATENLEPNTWYILRINVECITYTDRIIPIIYAPGKKGEIVADFKLTDLKGNVSLKKPVKMLGFEIDPIHMEAKVKFRSALGILSVAYECDYFDKNHTLHKRQASSTGDPDFAMKKETLNNRMVRYYCKSPINDSFDAMIFTIEWTEEKDR